MARDYTGATKWRNGTIRARTGPLSYEVEMAPNQFSRRHIDQLVSTSTKQQEEKQPETDHTLNARAEEEIICNNQKKDDAAPEVPAKVDGSTDKLTADQQSLETGNKCQTTERRYAVRARRPPDRFE